MKSLAWTILIAAFGALVLMSSAHRPDRLHVEGNPYHSTTFRSAYGGLPDTVNSLFTGSGKCAGCHATDPNHYASIVGQTYPAVPMPNGWDVNVTDDWRSTLMANSAKDPFWQAKVSQEVAVNPSHQLELEDKCTSCHAPLGHFAAHHDGEEFYSMAELLMDSLALDGVSCNACHQQSAENIGQQFSGLLNFVEDTLYGPYGGSKSDPLLYGLPMTTYVGYEPVFGQHSAESEVCAGCHSLITQTADLQGEATGQDFIEQATYHEWLNSIYEPDFIDDEPNGLQQECQGCHMPQIDDPVIISSGYAFLEPRSPYGLHYLVGANTSMLRLMRDHIEELGLTASEAQFDSTLNRTLEMLQQQSVDLTFESVQLDPGSGDVSVSVKLQNKAGHKFPSGYPARRVWLELEVTDGSGNPLWQSGQLAEDGMNIVGADEGGIETFQPHHDVITESSQVQIYEFVIADVTGTPTNLLERAAITLKDNRLLPVGFRTDHPAYDTTLVVGANVEWDMEAGDFNRSESGAEGTGADVVHYALTLPELIGCSDCSVTARLWYQAMPPRWVAPMFDVETDAIAEFESMYWDYAAPELVTEAMQTLVASSVNALQASSWKIYPNPSSNGRVFVESPAGFQGTVYEIFNASGQRVSAGPMNAGATKWAFDLPAVQGVYVVHFHGKGGSQSIHRIVRK
mgnify:FL=1